MTINDVHKILKELGSKEPKKDRNDNPIYTTVCHHGNSHKLYYYHDDRCFHCYTDCSETFNIFELVMKSKTISFPQAIQYVATVTNKTFGFGQTLKKSNSELITDWDWINKLKKKNKINIQLPEYDERVLDVLLPYPHIDWINEGISYETQQKFEVGYYIRDERITLVHRDIDGRFIGLRGRATRQEDIEAGKKYMPLTIQNKLYNHQTMMNLYGIHKTKEAIKRIRKAIIFEGEKSCLKCQDYYGEDNFSVAACSSTISNFQRDILVSLGVEEVMIAFDTLKNDATQEEIDRYQKNLLKFASKFTPYCRTYILYDDFGLLGEKESPVDRGKEVLESLMKCKYEINTKDGE